MMQELANLLEPLANIVGVDIDLIDETGKRLFATGIYKNRIGEKSSEQIYDKVIREKKTIIIESPRNNYECKECFNTNRCMKKILIATPIFSKQEVIGVISFLTFSEKKRDEILEKMEDYIGLLKKMSHNIGVKFFQETYFDLYHELFLKMKEAVFVINEKGLIIDYNRSAHVYFQNVRELFGKKINISSISEGRYNLSVSGTNIEIEGKITTYDGRRNYLIFKKINRDSYTNLSDGILIGKSKIIMELNKKIEKISKMNSCILIKGEIGTDKEMIAKLIHKLSPRADKPYIGINCRDEDEKTLEEKLFGNNVDENLQVGILESADGGTIFIDEIDFMPIKTQKKILNFLNTSKINPVNSKNLVETDIRVIVSTRIDLLDSVTKNEFLENLYYKLNSNAIEIPSLRYRKDDIEDIIEYLIEKHSENQKKTLLGIDDKAKKILMHHDWKGNWKEINNTIKTIVELTTDRQMINYELIPEKIREADDYLDKKYRKIKKISEIEREEIITALIQYGLETEGKQKAAKKLGIGIATLYRKIENYQIDKKEIKKASNLNK